MTTEDFFDETTEQSAVNQRSSQNTLGLGKVIIPTAKKDQEESLISISSQALVDTRMEPNPRQY